VKKPHLLIPGNPAVAEHYRSWIREIESRHGCASVTYASSHVLFSRRLNYLEYEAAMRGHYEALLLGLGSEEKVTVLAHSAGAYFALRLLEAHPERIERVVVMFPYIGYSTIK
jgi:pimeloyl-ACP methyl ester carboxylesterase